MKYESNNFELAKQDREEQDKNLIMGKSDLALCLNRPLARRGTELSRINGVDSACAGSPKGDDAIKNHNSNEIDEELLIEMCKFSNMSTANNVKKVSGNMVRRVNGVNGANL